MRTKGAHRGEPATPPNDDLPGSAHPGPADEQRPRRWRIVRAVLVGVALLVLVFHLAGGWYFSGQIESGALRIDPSTVSMDVRVVAVSGSSIIVHENGGHDGALRSDQVYGVKWDGGYGQISGPAAVSGRDVTRRFRLLTGAVPSRGAVAGLSRDAYPDDPEVAIGRPVQEVTYTSPLGAMPAWYVSGTSRTWAVLVHGWTASRTEMLRMMRVTVQQGLPSLDISYRNDEGVPADPSHHYQYGRTEWRDLDGAVRYARAHGARSVVLVGASMGGAIVASFMRHSARASIVGALVLDAPMLSLSRTVDLAASRRSLPVIGLPIPATLIWTAKRIAAVRYDLDWSATDYLASTKWDRVPTLLFHGDDDTRVPIGGSRALAALQPGRVRLLAIADAGHLESWNVDPAYYDGQLATFLRSHR